MRKTLLLATLLVASVFTAKAQITLSSSVETEPHGWDADNVYYDMSQVATSLGYADAAALGADLLAYVRNEPSDITILNVSKSGTETAEQTNVDNNFANYWHIVHGFTDSRKILCSKCLIQDAKAT